MRLAVLAVLLLLGLYVQMVTGTMGAPEILAAVSVLSPDGGLAFGGAVAGEVAMLAPAASAGVAVAAHRLQI